MGGDGDLHRLNYDSLVVALGGETATFGIHGITEYAVGMKTLADAFALRNRIIEMLERADLEDDPAERAAQLTFVVGGAGFSGVETAGEIEDFIRRVRRRFYPKIRADELRCHIVELKDRVLPEMPPEMGDYAARRLRQRGYEIHLGTPMKEVREDGVVIGDGEFIPARTVVWTGGVQPSPVVAGPASRSTGPAGRSWTRRWGRAAGRVGDRRLRADPRAEAEGTYHAPTAQNAVREAKRLARNVLASHRPAPGRRSSRSATASSERWPASATTPASASSSASRSAAGSRGSCGAATTGAGCRASAARRAWRSTGSSTRSSARTRCS